MLSELARYEDITVGSISFGLLPGESIPARFYNNAAKTTVALRSAYRLIKDKPLAFFDYPHSLTTFQNRLLFRLCVICRIPTVIDIHDTREQAVAVGNGHFGVRQAMEEYCFSRATLRIALNPAMWKRIRQVNRLDDVPVLFVPNGVEEDFFTQQQAPYSPVEGQFNVCYIGALTKNRGIDVLVRSCSILRERYPGSAYTSLDHMVPAYRTA